MIVEKIKNIRHKLKVKMPSIVLMLATFFNPLGFDALFKLVMNWTNSYWITDILFYSVSALLFTLYFFLVKRKT